ncbi:MAG: hypothetical protein HY075_14820 [Deltaproteobacteria bacterium]|nr:hypothetical protein [Deltaproteobacteria bacterium]
MLALLSSLFLAALASAACETADLNEDPASPLRKLPIYDQDGSGTCYAHEAATLVNFELAKADKKPRDFVNPLFAAWVRHYEDTTFYGSPDNTGGFSADVIKSLKKMKYCPQHLVEGCLIDSKKIGKMNDAKLVHFLEKLWENYSSFSTGDAYQEAIDKTVKEDDWIKGDPCAARALAENLKARHLEAISGNEVLKYFFDGCPASQRNELDIPDPEASSDGPLEAVRKRIDDALTRGAPVGIAICAEMLDTPDVRPLRWQDPTGFSRSSRGNLKKPCGNHAVTVTARRELDGKCMYMIRNSWGADWHPKNGRCACITVGGTYEPECKKAIFAKEYLGCWYSDEDLMSNVHSTTIIPEKK